MHKMEKCMRAKQVVEVHNDPCNRKHACTKPLFFTLYQCNTYIPQIKIKLCLICKINFFANYL